MQGKTLKGVQSYSSNVSPSFSGLGGGGEGVPEVRHINHIVMASTNNMPSPYKMGIYTL